MKIVRPMLAAIVMLCSVAGIGADNRLQGIDILILLDLSKSMAEHEKSVQSRKWLADEFVRNLVIPGDSVCLLGFYGQTKQLWDGPISSERDKADLMRTIMRQKPDGRWTDIGNALDKLKSRLEAYPADGRFKYIIMITDERQEAPPESRYFSRDGSFSHAYLRYVKKENHDGWSAVTLGVGIDEKVDNSVKIILPVLDALPEGRQPAAAGSADPGAGLQVGKFGPGRPGAWRRAIPAALLALAALFALLLATLFAKRIQSKRSERKGRETENDETSNA